MTGTSSRYPYPITNKYTFARVFSDPDNVRPLLEEVLGVPVGEIRIVEPEHIIEASLRGRGVRMDVFAADGSGTVFDVEMHNVDEGDLPLRTRYLLSSFDRDRIERGQPYVELGRTMVILVCCFDLFGLGKRQYVVQPTVVGHDLVFDDGTARVFLNAKGASKDRVASTDEEGEQAVSGRMAAFLSYVDGGDMMGDEWVERLDREVGALNADEGWRDAMLGIELDHQMEVYRAEQRGRERALSGIARLAAAMGADGRGAEFARAARDPEAIARLLEEYHLA